MGRAVAAALDQRENARDHPVHVLFDHADIVGQLRGKGVIVETAVTHPPGMIGHGTVEPAHHPLEADRRVHEQPRRQRARPRIQRPFRLVGGIAAGQDRGLGQGQAAFGMGGAKAADPLGGVVIGGPATDEQKRPAIAEIVAATVQDQMRQRLRPGKVVRGDRGRLRPRQIKVEHPHPGRKAQIGDPVGVGGAIGHQTIHLIGQKRPGRLEFQFRVALRAGHHRKHPMRAGHRLEPFRHRAEIAVVIFRHDHANDVRALPPQQAGLKIHRIALIARQVGDPFGQLFADPALFPGPVQHRADRAGRGPRQFGQVIDRRALAAGAKGVGHGVRHCCHLPS